MQIDSANRYIDSNSIPLLKKKIRQIWKSKI